MLSKTATMLLGLINEKPLNAYEITKMLDYMNVKWWFRMADSTVYATIKSLEKKELIIGTVEKEGNMPDKTIYALTAKGRDAFLDTLRQSILQFDYDTTVFSIAAFFLDALEPEEQRDLLEKRLEMLYKYSAGIERQVSAAWEREVPASHVANVKRMIELVHAEMIGTKKLLAVCGGKDDEE